MNKKYIKKGLTLALALSFSLSAFAGCGGTNSTSTASTTSETVSSTSSQGGGTTNIRFAWWGNQIRNDYTIAALDAYTELHPEITFESEFTDWNGYWDKLSTQAASNNLPDLVQMDLAYIYQYQTKQLIADITPYIDNGTIDISNVNEAILQSGIVNGGNYALCLGVNATATAYNADALKEAGLEIPEHPTYSELVDLAVKMKEAGYSSDLPAGDWALFMGARDFGQKFIKTESAEIGISQERAEAYFNNIKLAIDSDWGLTVDEHQNFSTAGLEGGGLATGKTWVAFIGSNQAAAVQNATDSKINMVMYPKFDDATEESMYLRASQFVSISSNSKYSEEAAKVVDYLTNSEVAQDHLKAERGVPISSAMAEYMRPSLDDVQKDHFDYIAKVTAVATPADPPMPTGANEVMKLVETLTDNVRYGEITPEEAATKLITEANAILEKANK